MKTTATNKFSIYIDIGCILLFSSLMYFALASFMPLGVPDGGRYAEIAREMSISGNFITPYLNGIKYLEKPPLFYWTMVLAIKNFGLHEWVLRLPNIFYAYIAIITTYLFSLKLYERQTAIFSSLVLTTSILFFAMSQRITLDMALTTWITVSLLSFLLATDCESGYKRRIPVYVAATATAAAVLTKGLVGLALPCTIIGIYIVVLNKWRLLRSIYLPSALLLFFIMVTPWHYLIQIQNPEFWRFYFVEQHFVRYLTAVAHREQPFWFFIIVVLIGFLPWIVFLPQAIKTHFPNSWQQRTSYNKEIFLLLWLAVTFVFFSCSHSKLVPYILPIFPALSILVGHYLALAMRSTFGLKAGFVILILACLTGLVILHVMPCADITTALPWLNIALIALLMTAGSALLLFKKHQSLAIYILILGAAIFAITCLFSWSIIDNRSIKPLAVKIKPLLQQDDEIISYRHYYQDLPVYLERLVTIVDWRNELDFGARYTKGADARLIDEKTLVKKWRSKKLYVFSRKRFYYDFKKRHPSFKIHTLGQTEENIVFTNTFRGQHER